MRGEMERLRGKVPTLLWAPLPHSHGGTSLRFSELHPPASPAFRISEHRAGPGSACPKLASRVAQFPRAQIQEVLSCPWARPWACDPQDSGRSKEATGTELTQPEAPGTSEAGGRLPQPHCSPPPNVSMATHKYLERMTKLFHLFMVFLACFGVLKRGSELIP